MKLNDYQNRALEFALPTTDQKTHYVLGLVEESGEVAGKFKRNMRDNYNRLSFDDKQKIAAELGDVLWYLSALANEIGHSLQDIAVGNLNKLGDRKHRNTLKGEGDDR